MSARFHRAGLADLEGVFALIDSRIAWMDETGLRHWNAEDYWRYYPREYYAHAAERGELYVLADGDGSPDAAACLFEDDAAWDDGEPALYVHNFAAALAKKGAGREFLRHAASLAASRGKTRLRLDCPRDAAALNRYYENQGFRACGAFSQGVYRGTLREKSDLPGTPFNVDVLLFPGFETLDAFGPVDILHRVPDFRLRYVSASGGEVSSFQGFRVATEPAETPSPAGALLVPGGMGTRELVSDGAFCALLRNMSDRATYCLSVCTGSALLAACGALDGRHATSNKRAFDWVSSRSSSVLWEPAARWTVDGRFYTSSGVSAGMDMALGFVADHFGRDEALRIAREIEYVWNDDPRKDPFSVRR